jgi:hypothetical protein
VNVKTNLFLGVRPCSLMHRCQCLVKLAHSNLRIEECRTLNTVTPGSFKTLVPIYRINGRHKTQDKDYGCKKFQAALNLQTEPMRHGFRE